MNSRCGSMGKSRESRARAGDNRLKAVAAEAESCERCPLYKLGTQTVFGEGPADAPVLMIGEQPGDQEDIAGRPFVGPAGRMLDRAMADAGIDRARVYVTNAVKHFKFELRGRRRLHKKPNSYEIERCHWWLAQELEIVRPDLVVAMGATAARAVLGKVVTVTALRGRVLDLDPPLRGIVTIHPSFLLRIRGDREKADAYGRFVADLALAARTVPAVRMD